MAILPIFIPHAGCPHQCVFCNQKTISGQHQAAVSSAARQIERWLQWLRPSPQNEAAFYGGSFTGLAFDLQKQLLQLTDDLLAKKIIGSVRLSTRPDYINEDVLELLRGHNVKLVELGVQSLDDKVLQAAERGHTAAAVPAAVKLLRRAGMKIGLQLMVGLPQQDFESVQNTVRQVVALQPDIARIYPLLVIKGTPLAGSWQEGKYQPLSLQEAVRQSAYVYRILTENGIQVIRVGLQPDEELCAAGNILAGPFHPSMGELVQSYLLKEQLTPELKKLAGMQEIVIYCPNKLMSKLRGLKNSNLRYWQKILAPTRINIQLSEDARISISTSNEKHNGI